MDDHLITADPVNEPFHTSNKKLSKYECRFTINSYDNGGTHGCTTAVL